MGIKAFFNYFYQGGKQVSDLAVRTLSPEMEPGKAKKISTAIDVGAGSLLTYLSGVSTLGWAAVAVTAVTTIMTAPVAFVPAAVGSLVMGTFMGGLNLLGTVFGVGLLSSGMDKLNITKPKAAVAKAGRAAESTAQAVTKPFKWVGNKLSSAFKKAHDGAAKAPKAARRAAAPQPGQFQV